MPEFQIRVEVLKRLQYVSADNTVAVKGRVACEINSGDELVATEMIFAGGHHTALPAVQHAPASGCEGAAPVMSCLPNQDACHPRGDSLSLCC